MKILIYGAGAIGIYIGGHLALADHEVTFLGRPGLRQAFDESGCITIKRADGAINRIGTVRIVTDIKDAFAEAQPYDWVAFTMKAYDTSSSLMELIKVEESVPAVVSFQNGVGNEESLASALGAEKVVGGAITTPVSLDGPAIVIEEARRGIGIAADVAAARPVIDALRQTSLNVVEVPDMRSLKWSKLLLNIVGNATSAILDMAPGDIFANPALFGIEHAALQEATGIMALQNIKPINLPGMPAATLAGAVRLSPEWLLRPVLRQRVLKGRGNKMPSLHIALSASQRRTEVPWLNGAIALAADRLDRVAPVNHALALVVSDIATGKAPWSMYRHKPDMLLTAVRAARVPTLR